jgi:hypothetical protein
MTPVEMSATVGKVVARGGSGGQEELQGLLQARTS